MFQAFTGGVTGPRWSPEKPAGPFDLPGSLEGAQYVKLPGNSLNLPVLLGVQVERLPPDSILVVLTRK